MEPCTWSWTVTLVVALLACLNTAAQAYRLEGNLELNSDPALELFRYLSKWVNFRDIHSFGDIHPEGTYTFHLEPEEIPFEPEVEPLIEPHGEGSGSNAKDDSVYDLEYLSFIEKEHLKSIGSIEELAEITGLPLSSQEETEVSMSASLRRRPTFKSRLRQSRPRGSSRGKANDSMAKRAVCEPEKVSVTLKAEEGFRVIPSCVRIKKCGGCCNPGLVCVPTKVKKLKLKVVELALNGSLLESKILENVTEDEECGCQCGVREEHCLPTQDYDPDSCSCFCKPEFASARRECENNGRIWDSYRCTCQCPLYGPVSDADCGSGQIFNPDACKCETAE